MSEAQVQFSGIQIVVNIIVKTFQIYIGPSITLQSSTSGS